MQLNSGGGGEGDYRAGISQTSLEEIRQGLTLQSSQGGGWVGGRVGEEREGKESSKEEERREGMEEEKARRC